jgi:hypothetical protein
MGTKTYRMTPGKGHRGSVAVHSALGYDRAGGGAERGIPEPKGKQRDRWLISVHEVSKSMKRSKCHV